MSGEKAAFGTQAQVEFDERYPFPIWNDDNAALSILGTLATKTGLTCVEGFNGVQHITRFIFTAMTISTTDDGTNGYYGSQLLYTFPAGNIIIRRAYGNYTSLAIDGTGLVDGDHEIGVGEDAIAAAATALTADLENILLGKVITFASEAATNQTIADATANQDNDIIANGAGTAYLNIAGAAAASDGDGTMTITGYIDVVWENAGVTST